LPLTDRDLDTQLGKKVPILLEAGKPHNLIDPHWYDLGAAQLLQEKKKKKKKRENGKKETQENVGRDG
jgi:hypothetical protein